MPDLDVAAFDEQDQSEVFDEDDANDMDRGPGEEAEQFEDLMEVFDATSAVGDDDDDEGRIAEDLDDDEIIALADHDDDELAAAGLDEADEADGVSRPSSEEVELEYTGDLSEIANARSATQDTEIDPESDEDLDDLRNTGGGRHARV